MKYTLFAFKTEVFDLKAQPLHSDPTSFAQLLASTEKHRADVCEGVYVFETQPGWRDIQLLRRFLEDEQRQFVELQFEQGLSGFLPLSTRDKLKAIGIGDDALFNLSE